MVIKLKKYSGKITYVQPNSLAEELELKAGDKIIEINGRKLRDIIDLSFELADEEIEMLVEHSDGQREIIAFDKDADEELGVEFESAVFDGIQRCKNHCVFCFVDMIAPQMRRTLSIKDDDYRMSFLYGNFITLTNLNDNDYKRIKQYHLSPLFVSVHTMNPELRVKMLRTPLAANISADLDKLEAAGADYHTQIVLCAGLNDGDELER
ncbi:MAG: PDZ domain-containing protein, partial [Selenomonadaceae bacterium]|nr:PDZ domain-containing protein [Selenomonadaceae bacterium]